LRLTPPFNLPALGRRQPPYVVFTTLRRPVFLVNSRLGHFSATSLLVNEATLLPKLRVHFAEFLNECSHKRLRILTPPTCVGLRYGQIACIAERGFSWQLGSATFFRPRGRTFVPVLTLMSPGFAKATGYDGSTGKPSPVLPTLLRPPTAHVTGSGILTGFPSTTPLGLALGADLP
jgi:hypothetical protein